MGVSRGQNLNELRSNGIKRKAISWGRGHAQRRPNCLISLAVLFRPAEPASLALIPDKFGIANEVVAKRLATLAFLPLDSFTRGFRNEIRGCLDCSDQLEVGFDRVGRVASRVECVGRGE